MAQFDPQALPSATSRHFAARAGWPTRLAVEIWLHRHGWALPCSVVLLLLAGVLLLTQVLPLRSKVDRLQIQLLSAQSRPKAAPLQTQQTPFEPGQSLRALLSQVERNPAQIRHIVKLARLHGINLPRGQYTSARQTPSGIEHTDITFRFAAAYPPSRAFIEGVLRELPSASVDRMSFERDQAQGAEAEVTLRLTLWWWPAPSTSEGMR
jgi:hypothetical protein